MHVLHVCERADGARLSAARSATTRCSERTGSCVAARSIAVESGRRVCWTGRASRVVSTIGAKWRCRASGCSELLARQRRSVGGTGRWRRTTPAWRLGVCVVGGLADGQCGDVMVSRAGWATVAATGVRATTVGQRRGAWASDDDDDERTAADGNVLASATVVEVRRVRHDEAGGRRVQATPSTSRMGGTRAMADRHAGRVQGGESARVVLDQAGGGRRRRLGGGVRATRVRRRDGQARCARRAAAVASGGRDVVAVASGRGRGAAGAGEQLSKAQAVEACGAVRRGERRRAAELCCLQTSGRGRGG